jgi:molybdopterin molybdotransferase
VTTPEGFLARALEGLKPLDALEIPLLEAAGCATADDVVAPHAVPMRATATVDGYCVRMPDVVAATAHAPSVVPVVGDVKPGDPPTLSVQPGFCVRIVAGAAVPSGTEGVVPLDDTDGGIARVAVRRAPAPGANILDSGALLPAGRPLIPATTRLRPQHLGLLAAAGINRVAVSPRPRVVVVPVGDELAEPGAELAAGKWSDASGPLLTASLRDAGALAFRVPALPADIRTLLDTIEDQLVRADLVVVVDAFGVGEQAVIRDVLSRLGDVVVEELTTEPLRTLGFGRVGPDAIPLVVVPQDPVSAFVAGETVLRPMVRRMLGIAPERRGVVRAVLRGALRGSARGARYVPADLGVIDGVYAVTPVDGSDHPLLAVAQANALVVLPQGAAGAADGTTVDVVVLERRHA